ncbi:DUF4190 domain-containing protein [Kitasatospora griseola]|uniref:DUF4190 domain-containing protein n=1 Tax=Kitasatospora griseola TaxID=2064 RepID=UPI000695CF9D|nr:DUF4190 domain-containing protein [Kitasatospora griseola]
MTVPALPDRPEPETAAAAPVESESEARPASEAEATARPEAAPEAKAEPAPSSAPVPAPSSAPVFEDAPAPAKNPWAAPDPNAVPPAAPPPMPGPVPGPFPAPGQYPNGMYWAQYPVPTPEPRNGVGITALVLGIVGVVLCLPLFLFWLSWLPALLAVCFGGVGLSLVRKRLATNRAMALTGTVLGVVGLLASVSTGVLLIADLSSDMRERSRTVKQQERDDSERRRLADERSKKAAAEQAAREADEKARRLSFGGSYTYPDGLKVTMAAPTPASPPSRSSGVTFPPDTTYIQVQVTVVNTGSAELSLYGSGSLLVKDSRGSLARPVFSSDQFKMLPQTLGPGQEATALEEFALPNASADPFTLQFTHGTRMERKDVIWAGSAPR